MARQNINIGTTANDGSGDSLRVSFNKVNQNFIEVYSSIGSAFSGNYNDLTNKPTLFSGNYNDLTNKPTLFSGNYNDLTNKPVNISSFTNDSGYITSSISDDFIPTADNEYDLGSPTNQWRSLYVSANTIFIGGTPISVDAGGNLLVDGSSVLIGTVDWENIVDTPNTVSYFTNDAGYLTSETDTLDDVVGRNANTSISITVGGLTSTGILKVDDGVHEKFQALVDATGTVTHDCSNGHVFYHTSPDANWTANFTNLNLSTGYVTAVSLVIVQGATGYYPNAVQIGGVGQTINWQGNSTPIASSSRTDVVTFSILNNSGTYTVLGQLTGF